MGYKINGEVIISNSKDIDNVGIATIGLVDAKVSAKAITEQTEGGVSDVTGADEVLIYDAEGGSLLRVTVDEFISGSGIGTLVTDFDNLVVTGVATVGVLTATWVSGNLQGVLYNSTGNPVLDPDGPGFGGTVFGNVVSNVNTGFSTFNNIMVSGMHTAGIITCDYIYGGFSGKIYNNQGNPIFNSEDASFGGTVFGDVVAGSSGLSTFKDLNVTGVATIANIAMASTQSSITLPDSAEIILGDSADFSIHHDGDHTYLDESGQGNLKIRTNNFRVTNVAETKPSITAQVTQGVELHYDGNKKLETTNTGVVVTGVITATDANFRNLQTAGITTIQDHLEVNDSTGSGTEYNLNVKTSGSSTFGVLGNGAILLGNNASAPFIATNDHHATSKKYVDDAIAAAPSGGGTRNFVATGTIPDGRAVVINANGTVSVADNDIAAGAVSQFKSGNLTEISVAYDTANDKIVVFYRDTTNSSAGTAVVGTVIGNTISFGSPVVFNSNGSEFSATYDSTSGKVVAAYMDITSGGARAIVGTVSGTSISFGSPTTFNSGNTFYISAVYEPVNSKVVIAYYNNGGFTGDVIVGTVSGTSISFGTAVIFNANATGYLSATYDSDNGKIIIAYGNTSTTQVEAIVGTVSKTSISFGTAAVVSSVNSTYVKVIHDSDSGKAVVAYVDKSNNDYGTASVGTVSGTSISFGSPVVFNSNDSSYVAISKDTKILIAFRNNGNSGRGEVVEATVSGTSISFSSSTVFESGNNIAYISLVYDSSSAQVIAAYVGRLSSAFGGAKTLRSSNLTDETFIGIADGAISNAATGKVTIVGGVNSKQTGLTVARKYYVQGDGSLALTADTPSVVAGTSISATEILVR